MQIQVIFKAGNSNVVAIPPHLMQELGFVPGQKVVVEKSSDDETITIKKVVPKKTKTKSAQKSEFKAWLDVFIKENGEILDELAVR